MVCDPDNVLYDDDGNVLPDIRHPHRCGGLPAKRCREFLEYLTNFSIFDSYCGVPTDHADPAEDLHPQR